MDQGQGGEAKIVPVGSPLRQEGRSRQPLGKWVFIGARTVNRRYQQAEFSQVHGELSAMVIRVIEHD